MKWTPLMLLLATFVALGYVNVQEDGGLVASVRNESAESIASIEVAVLGVSSVEAGSLRPGAEFAVEVAGKPSASCAVRIEFSSGRRLTKELGYVAEGALRRSTVVVGESGIEVVESRHFLPSPHSEGTWGQWESVR